MTRQECETHIVYEQEKALQRLCAQWLRNSGGVFVVVRRLEDLVEALVGG